MALEGTFYDLPVSCYRNRMHKDWKKKKLIQAQKIVTTDVKVMKQMRDSRILFLIRPRTSTSNRKELKEKRGKNVAEISCNSD